MKNTYIIVQMIVEKMPDGMNHNVLMSNIIRMYDADNKEAAIGKFVLDTANVPAVKKLQIECFEFVQIYGGIVS